MTSSVVGRTIFIFTWFAGWALNTATGFLQNHGYFGSRPAMIIDSLPRKLLVEPLGMTTAVFIMTLLTLVVTYLVYACGARQAR